MSEMNMTFKDFNRKFEEMSLFLKSKNKELEEDCFFDIDIDPESIKFPDQAWWLLKTAKKGSKVWKIGEASFEKILLVMIGSAKTLMKMINLGYWWIQDTDSKVLRTAFKDKWEELAKRRIESANTISKIRKMNSKIFVTFGDYKLIVGESACELAEKKWDKLALVQALRIKTLEGAKKIYFKSRDGSEAQHIASKAWDRLAMENFKAVKTEEEIEEVIKTVLPRGGVWTLAWNKLLLMRSQAADTLEKARDICLSDIPTGIEIPQLAWKKWNKFALKKVRAAKNSKEAAEAERCSPGGSEAKETARLKWISFVKEKANTIMTAREAKEWHDEIPYIEDITRNICYGVWDRLALIQAEAAETEGEVDEVMKVSRIEDSDAWKLAFSKKELFKAKRAETLEELEEVWKTSERDSEAEELVLVKKIRLLSLEQLKKLYSTFDDRKNYQKMILVGIFEIV